MERNKILYTLKARTYSISILSIILLVIATAFSSCSTKKNTATRRAFHNLTAHYNPYWNGYEAYKQGLRDLDNQIKTDYTKILPVKEYGTLQQVQSINMHLDRAIEKASKVAQKHSMFFERREHVKRVKDSYMLIGKSYFYKQDYFNARQTFEFVARQYERQPIRFEAQLWQARTAIKMREFERSITLIEGLQNQVRRQDFPRNLHREIPVVFAEHYMGQENYQAAKPHLRKAAELSRDKNFRARMYFILGQIHQMEENYTEASRFYAMVIKEKPDYEMTFNARINRAQSFDARSGNSREITSELNKLLRDSKNQNYHDQIYYALATVALRENNDSAAFRLLRRSVASSVENDFQKTLSARKLADLYFQIPNYKEAYAYYDTTMQAMQYDHPDYNQLDRKTRTLRELVGHMNTIQTQDSLQRLAAMPEADRNKIIDQLIAEHKAEQDRIKEEEQQMAMADRSFTPMPGRDPSRGMLQQVTGGGWYFYNPQAVSFGFSDFTRKWGRRKLEDNWRLSDKRVYTFDVADMQVSDADTLGSKEDAKANDPMNRDTYLRNIPTTPEQMEASNRLIADAMYQLAYVFREGFRDYPRSSEGFEAFLSRFPGHTRDLDALYHLYTLYTLMGNASEAGRHKNTIIQKYPDSEYAAILSDPDYFTKQEQEKRRVAALYEDAFNAYKSQQYRMVVIYSNEAERTYPDSPLLPKFAFLRTLSKGSMHNQDTLINELKVFIAGYPSSDLVPMAQDILGTFGIEGFVDEESQMDKKKEEPSIYSFSANDNHFFVMIVNHNRINVDATRVRISDYNSRNYNLDKLTVNAVLIDDDHQMISVSNFRGRDRAMAYYHAISASDYVFEPQLRRDARYFAISSDNYPVFYRDKDVEKYMRFFEKHYLNK